MKIDKMIPLLSRPAIALLGLLTWSSHSVSEIPNQPISSNDPIFSRDALRINSIVCPFKGEVEYEPGEIECGLLEVPENREQPDSRFIELHFVKINAKDGLEKNKDKENEKESEKEKENEEESEWTKPKKGVRPDPVVYLTGGPGAPVNSYVSRFKDHLLVNHRDLYILEQRGIGVSDDFCPHYSSRNKDEQNQAVFAQYSKQSVNRANQCAENAARSGVDLTGYHTIENARDVQALRMALGFKQWNVWGISYGSILGQAYLKQDPNGILSAAIDAIMPITARDQAEYWRISKWYDRNLQKLEDACQAHDDCKAQFSNFGEKVRDSIKLVQDSPIEVDVKNVESYPSGKAYLFSDTAGYLPFSLMYEQSNYPALPNIIYEWNRAIKLAKENPEDAEYQKIFKLVLEAVGDGFGISQGMNDTLLCQDGGKASQAASVIADKKEFPILTAGRTTDYAAETMASRCLADNIAPRPASEYLPTVTDIPTLIIEGDMDPITPPPLAEVILPGFKNGTYIEFPYAGHGPSRSVKCAGDMLTLFYDNPTATPDTSCVEQMKVPEFLDPLFRTSIGVDLGLMALTDKKQLLAPGAWLSITSVGALVAFLVLSINAINRRLDRQIRRQGTVARRLVWGSSLIALISITIFAGAVIATVKSSEMLILFGLVSWAWWGGMFALISGLLAIAGIYKTIESHLDHPLRFGSLTGFVITGLLVFGFSLFVVVWGLGPF